MTRLWIDERRRGQFRHEVPTESPPDNAFQPDPQGSLDERQRLLDALAVLSPRQRAVLVLRFWEDLSVDETAHALGCSAGTVKSQTHHGLRKLRDRLGGDQA